MKNRRFYDYIIIGTGPAGAVIANTLSKNKRTSVLVLEAGGNHDRDQPIRDSTFASELEEQYSAQYFWQAVGIPQSGLDERTFEWTTGRLSGGGSSINGEQYVRPTSEVMRNWQRLLGSTWSPAKAVQRFKQLESFSGETNNVNAHGYHGHISIRQAPDVPTTMAKKLTSAIERATGLPSILDYNDPRTPLGPFTRWQLYQQLNGERESSSTAFLSPETVNSSGQGVRGRQLTICYHTTVLRVLFSNKRASGVEFIKKGTCMRAYARKQIIISAGINSAQLLLLSGIGPADSLRKAKIPVIFHNPNVGKALRNHTLNFASFTINRKDRALPDNDPNALYTGGAFLPDPLGADPHRRAVQLIGIGSDDRLNLAIIYLRPKSRGSIKIQNKDPLQIVLADEGFLSNPEDMEAVKNIYRIYIKEIATELNRIDSAYQLLSPDQATIDDDEKLEAFIKDNFDHNHHQQGSLRMAPLSKGGVVDRLGRVHGVKGLIVADASIIPYTVDGNTSAAAYLIGYTIARNICRSSARRKIQRFLHDEYEEE